MASRMWRVCAMMLCVGLLLAGCGGRRSETVKAEAELDAVTVRTGSNTAFQPLAASATTDLRTGDQLDVSASGRALLRFGDAITLEVFRDGDLALKSVPARGSDPVVTVLLSFGALFGRVDQAAATSRVSVQTNLLEVISTGTEFLVVSEAGSGRDWVFGIKDNVRVHSWNEPQVEWSVGAGQASWTDPSGPAHEPVTLGEERWARLLTWYRNARAGRAVQDVQEAIFPDGMPDARGAAPDCNFVLNFQDAQTDDWSKFRMAAPAGEGYVVFTLGEGEYAGAYCGGNFPLPALYGAILRMDFSGLQCQVRQASVVSFAAIAATSGLPDGPVEMAGFGVDGGQVARGREVNTDNPKLKRLFALGSSQPLAAAALTGSGLCLPCVSFQPLDAAPYDCSAVLR